MGWSSNEIKSLRLKLGWSLANMARRLKVSTEDLRDWEEGVLSPSPLSCADLEKMNIYLSQYSTLIKNSPQIDSQMESENLEQMVHSDINTPLKL